ncbi:MAG: hypothetical protein ACI4WG_06930 [Erysipelotrichaceae bacterium]
MKFNKTFAFFAAAALAINVTATTAFAHNTTDCGLKHTVSTTHWDLYEDSIHWSSYATKMTVNCGIFEGTAFETYINNAVTTWNNSRFNGQDLMSIDVDNTNGCVRFRNKSADQMAKVASSTTWAVTYRPGAKSDGTSYHHYSTEADSIEIWINYNSVLVNKSSNAKTHVPLHELGHVIGLVDIPSSVSVNGYLMCNEFGNYPIPTSITTADLQGAAVILGQHTTHNFVYSNYNSQIHKKTCKTCGAYNYYYHTFVNNVCKYCGYNSTSSASIGDYENNNAVVNDEVIAEFENEVDIEKF